MKKMILLLLLLTITNTVSAAGRKNKGHRLGGGKGSLSANLPENSLQALEALYQKYGAETKNWGTIEFDLRETGDGVLVAMHDGYLLGPAGELKKVKQMTYSELKKYAPLVPTMTEVLDSIKRFHSETKIFVEIKSLLSDFAREQMIALVDELRLTHARVKYGAFRGNFKRSFPRDKKKWCKKLRKVIALEIYFKNHCRR